MAGTVTVTATDIGGGFTKYAIAWTSDSSGAVSGTAVSLKRGELRQVKYVPGGGGTQPTDAYDVTMAGTDGFDILTGTGANLSNANTKISCPLIGDGTNTNQRLLLEAGDYTPSVTNAGNAKTGTITLYVFG